jgi:hypothetical protein
MLFRALFDVLFACGDELGVVICRVSMEISRAALQLLGFGEARVKCA